MTFYINATLRFENYLNWPRLEVQILKHLPRSLQTHSQKLQLANGAYSNEPTRSGRLKLHLS